MNRSIAQLLSLTGQVHATLLPALSEFANTCPRYSQTCTSLLPQRCKLHSRSWLQHGGAGTPKPGEPTIQVTFQDDKDGSSKTVAAPLGTNLLEVAHANDVDLEGACEGSLACSTCHVIVTEQSYYDRIPEADDDENDMLDLAFGLTDTSRLGCQVKTTPDLDGIVLRIPSATRNFAVDGHVPKPH